jgi:isoleucyl-tRNA synthetase
MWDTQLEKSNTNVMDRWILASCQSLLEFVNQEMKGMWASNRLRDEN